MTGLFGGILVFGSRSYLKHAVASLADQADEQRSPRELTWPFRPMLLYQPPRPHWVSLSTILGRFLRSLTSAAHYSYKAEGQGSFPLFEISQMGIPSGHSSKVGCIQRSIGRYTEWQLNQRTVLRSVCLNQMTHHFTCSCGHLSLQPAVGLHLYLYLFDHLSGISSLLIVQTPLSVSEHNGRFYLSLRGCIISPVSLFLWSSLFFSACPSLGVLLAWGLKIRAACIKIVSLNLDRDKI